MKLRSVREILVNTRVILRMDLDVPMEDGVITDTTRLEKSIPTIRLLLDKGCHIAIIGHRGRPKGYDPELSLKPVYLDLMGMLEPDADGMVESVFVEEVNNQEILDEALADNQIVFLENLRFYEGEEKNDPNFLKELVGVSQMYVNDAFAVAHRPHRSIMLWQELPAFYGLSFVEEVEKIEMAVVNPRRPFTIILGGAKEDKLKYLDELEKIADNILIGGKLPRITNYELRITNKKISVAELREDGLDLSEEDINKFGEIIRNSKTIIWVGAMGMFEDNNCKRGTEAVAEAVAKNNGYKIVAGGDTVASLKNQGVLGQIDYVCSGGGVLLEFLIQGKLLAF